MKATQIRDLKGYEGARLLAHMQLQAEKERMAKQAAVAAMVAQFKRKK